MKRNYILLWVVCIMLGMRSQAFAVGVADAPGTYTIVLTPQGFVPRDISVPTGSTVLFKTTTGRTFWPASDDHPSHTVYPQFDPKEPVLPDAEWSFRFDREGSWKFHDHISPYFTGTVTVTSSKDPGAVSSIKSNTFVMYITNIFDIVNKFITQRIAPIDYRACQDTKLSRSDRIGCWEKIVVTMVQRKGLNPVLSFVETMKSRDIRFAADCHVYMHRIGEEYYWQFEKKRKVEVSDKFGMCDLGFFHGFMQEFTSHGRSPREAKRFCDVAVPQIKDSDYSAELLDQCYHGVGHGLAFMYAPSHWDDPDTTMALGIADCKSFLTNSRECINGVYGGMAAMFWGLHGYKLDYNDEDPFYICKNQKQPEALGCYNMFVPVVYGQFDMDIVKSGSLLLKIPDEDTKRVTMEHLGSMPSYTLVPKTDDYSQVITACDTFPEPYSMYCLEGFSGAIMRIGGLADAKRRAERFCTSTGLRQSQRAGCFTAAVKQMGYRFSRKEAIAYCKTTPVISREIACDSLK